METLDEGTFFTPPTTVAPSLMSSASFASTSSTIDPPTTNVFTGTEPGESAYAAASQAQEVSSSSSTVTGPNDSTSPTESPSTTSAPSTGNALPILPSATKAEQFLLTAADQEDGPRVERLNRVIKSKYEAGLLKPYNYVTGYHRLSRWMDRKYVNFFQLNVSCISSLFAQVYHQSLSSKSCNLFPC